MKEKKTEKDLSIIDSQDEILEDASPENAYENTLNPSEGYEKEKKKIKPWILIASVVLIFAILAVGVFTWYKYTTLAT